MMSAAIPLSFKLSRNGFVSGILCILIGLLILTGDVSAQHYPRKKFTIRDGLPQSQVLAVNQHDNGYIWLTTKGGIARFDGKVFESFGIQEGYHPDQYRQLDFSNDSTLILGEQRGIVQWFCLRNNRFHRLQLRTNKGITTNWRVMLDHTDRLLFASKRQPVGSDNDLIWILEDSILVPSKEHEHLSKQISGVQNWAYNKSDSALWICDYKSQLFRIKDEQVQLMRQFKSDGKYVNVQFLKGSEGEFLGFVPDEHVVYKLEEHAVSVHKKLPISHVMANAELRSILAIDQYNHYFLLVDNNELWALFDGAPTWTFIDEFNLANHLFIDRENNLYVPEEGALCVYNNFAFRHFTPEEDGIPKYIWSIVEDDQSRLWLGSYGHGLHIWDRADTSMRNLSNDYTDYEHSNPLDRIYMGARKVGKDILIPGGHSIYVYEQNGQLKKKLGCQRQPTLILYEDTLLKRIYAGTTAGVFVFDYNYHQIELMDDSVLTQRPVVSIAKDQQGNLWMGTWENVIRYDGEAFTHPFKNVNGESISAKCIQTDRDGNIWFGSHQGLYFFDGDSLNEIEEKLFKSVISFIIEMDEHRLLVGLTDGVAMIDLQKYFSDQRDWYSYYGEELGFTGIEPGQNGAVRTRDGQIWIITTDQLSLLNPALMKPASDNKIDVQIGAVQSFNPDADKGELMTEMIPRLNKPRREISYEISRLRIHYKAINHTSPNDIQYKYRLLGFDEEWSPSYEERFAEYTNLDPGNYTFQVEAHHKSQPAPGQPTMASFSFSIPSPYYLTWWFIVLVILFGGTAISYATVIIVRNRRTKREQEDQLKLEMCQLQYRALKAQVEPHFASNLLNSVNAAILKEDKLQASRVLSHFARLIRDILQHNDRMVYSLREELDFIKLYIDLERNVLKDKMQYVVQVDPGVNLDRKIPVMLLHTFVENSIKHAIRPNAEGGTIHLTLSADRTGIHIQISDTGSGNQPDKSQIVGSGKGVSLVDRIMEIHNRRNKQKMTIQIDDRDSGRKVLIFIPESFIFGSPEPMHN